MSKPMSNQDGLLVTDLTLPKPKCLTGDAGHDWETGGEFINLVAEGGWKKEWGSYGIARCRACGTVMVRPFGKNEWLTLSDYLKRSVT